MNKDFLRGFLTEIQKISQVADLATVRPISEEDLESISSQVDRALLEQEMKRREIKELIPSTYPHPYMLSLGAS